MGRKSPRVKTAPKATKLGREAQSTALRSGDSPSSPPQGHTLYHRWSTNTSWEPPRHLGGQSPWELELHSQRPRGRGSGAKHARGLCHHEPVLAAGQQAPLRGLPGSWGINPTTCTNAGTHGVHSSSGKTMRQSTTKPCTPTAGALRAVTPEAQAPRVHPG